MMIFMLSHYRLLARIQGQLFLLPKTPAPVLQGRGLNFLLERAYARCYKLIDDGTEQQQAQTACRDEASERRPAQARQGQRRRFRNGRQIQRRVHASSYARINSSRLMPD